MAMSVSPEDGGIWLYRLGGSRLTGLMVGVNGEVETREVELDEAAEIESLTVSDRGHLVISDAGTLKEFDAQGQGVEDSRVTGMRADQRSTFSAALAISIP